MNAYEIRYTDEQGIHQSIMWASNSMVDACRGVMEMNVVEILSISLAEKGEQLGYDIIYVDRRGHRRVFHSREDDLRRAVEQLYLDECPTSITSVIRVHG